MEKQAVDRPEDRPEDNVLHVKNGIPGFPTAEHFTLTDLTDDGIFQQLHCLEDPDLVMVVLFPWLAFPDYSPDLPDGELRHLGIQTPEDVVLFCTVTVDDEAEQIYVNLRAPFVANARTLVARQLVLDDDTLPLRAAIPSGG